MLKIDVEQRTKSNKRGNSADESLAALCHKLAAAEHLGGIAIGSECNHILFPSKRSAIPANAEVAQFAAARPKSIQIANILLMECKETDCRGRKKWAPKSCRVAGSTCGSESRLGRSTIAAVQSIQACSNCQSGPPHLRLRGPSTMFGDLAKLNQRQLLLQLVHLGENGCWVGCRGVAGSSVDAADTPLRAAARRLQA